MSQGSLSNAAPTRILRLPGVIAVVGISRSNILKKTAAGEFPKPVRLGARAVGWKESDVLAWLASREVAR
jgi:prophage regulatory protein